MMIEGARPTTRNARKIDFWVVNVVAKVASIKGSGWVSSHSVVASAW